MEEETGEPEEIHQQECGREKQLARGLFDSWRTRVKFVASRLSIENVKYVQFYGNGRVVFAMSRMEVMTTGALHGFCIYQEASGKNLCS